ncbi:MAG: alpha-L-fucosidase [Spirochaetaceae bacterium]
MQNIVGNQRLSIDQLKKYEELKYGMFIHWGMSTFDGKELSSQEAIKTYNPTDINVDEWISVARDAGMKYAVLTTKHVAGHALWPSKYGDYSVKNSSVTTDVVGQFVDACRSKGILPGFYYCAWDNTNLFGMESTPDWTEYEKGMCYTNPEYIEFMQLQMKELVENYSPDYFWIDMPKVLPLYARLETYKQLTELKPSMITGFNHSCQDGTKFDPTFAWPSDFMTLERTIPNSNRGHDKKSYYNEKLIMDKKYYIPGEMNDTIGKEWFYEDDDEPRSDEELLGMYLASTSRGVNFLLNCPPDRQGRMPKRWIDSLMRLRKKLDTLNML